MGMWRGLSNLFDEDNITGPLYEVSTVMSLILFPFKTPLTELEEE